MSIKDGFKKLFTYDDEPEKDEYIEVDEEDAAAISKYESPKSKTTVNKTMNIVMFEPRTFDEVPEIAKHLIAKRAAVVNLKKLSREYKQRTIDFLYGVTYGLRGTTRSIDVDSILCTPANIGVDGDISQEADGE